MILRERLSPLQLSTASAIDWEHCIVEGHPTHPMHSSRFAVPPTLPVSPEKDLRFPTIHFCAVRRSLVTIRGPFDKLLSPLLQDCQDAIDWPNEAVVPVHELQLPNIHAKFPQARQLSLTYSARAQASLRSVIVDPLRNLNLKLALGMKVSSCTRTISPWSTHIGPSFGPIAERVIETRLSSRFAASWPAWLQRTRIPTTQSISAASSARMHNLCWQSLVESV
ncbi:hypothetical protein L7F22_043075 [Adiantum nelumboides]|nr:hypothetical protein [Adiantum nelumboides]